ncbi:hypothetical protein [Streptomyces sp. NPDC046870]|uniref:hypothetical protein n=1 Tax=Streptomyces sp. NPDC046870 TaxID=3155135 RepID=UPI003456F575
MLLESHQQDQQGTRLGGLSWADDAHTTGKRPHQIDQRFVLTHHAVRHVDSRSHHHADQGALTDVHPT